MALTRRTFALSTAAAALLPRAASAATKFPGVTDTEIRIGSTGPLSGPAASWSTVNKVVRALFESVNAAGGVNGRQLKLILLDDGYSPPRTVEQTRKLVEVEQVSFVTAQIGSAPGLAARRYLNDAKVPQLFACSGADAWIDEIRTYPWSLGWAPLYSDEGRAAGKWIAANKPGAKVAILYQNDEAGRGYLRGLKEGLGAASPGLLRAESYESTDPSVDSQIVSLQSTGADVLALSCNPKTSVQAIRKSQDTWRPQMFMNSSMTSVAQVLTPAGLERAKGALSFAFAKDPTSPAWANDPGVRDFNAMMDKFGAGLPHDALAALGASLGATVVQLVRQCGNDLSRENLVKQTMAIDLDVPMLLPGVRIHTTPQNRHPVRELRAQRFDGTSWTLVAQK